MSTEVTRKILGILALLSLAFAFAGCASLVDEDENEQQTPWGGPADWEGQVPGMPSGTGPY